ncbi:MAG: acyl-ACP thioesterase domain-containing protein [Eubacteriales bacterium]
MIKNTIKIEGYDVFADGSVKLSALLRYMQQAAAEDLDSYGVTYDQMRGDDLVFVIVKIGIELSGVIKKGDEIEILTVNTAVNGITFVREFILYKNSLPIAKSTTHWVLMSYSRRVPVRPSRLNYKTQSLGDDFVGVKLPRTLFDEESFDFTSEHKVAYTEIDINNHMNNTVYADLVYNYAPEDIVSGFGKTRLAACSIYFNGEARLGDILTVKVKSVPGGHIIKCLNKKTGKSCFDANAFFK